MRKITYEMLLAICELHGLTLYVVNHCKEAYHLVHVTSTKKKIDHCLKGARVSDLIEMMYKYLETGGFIKSTGNEVDPSENELAPSGLSTFL